MNAAVSKPVRPANPSPADRLTLGQLCRRVGLARSSVLHYEALGLLAPAARSEAGYRLYGTAQLQRLQTIRQYRDAGLSLRDIQAMLRAPATAVPAKASVPAQLLQRRLLNLSTEVERLREQQRLLARLLASPSLHESGQAWDKAAWVALLEQAGFDEDAMQRWHTEFERESPADHAHFLRSLGLTSAEVQAIRRRSQTG